MNVAARFGENLANHRKRAHLSQEGLAARAGLHRTEIGVLERGKRLARIDTLVKLAGALDISVEHLLEGIAWSPTVPQQAGEWIDPGIPHQLGATSAGPSLPPRKPQPRRANPNF